LFQIPALRERRLRRAVTGYTEHYHLAGSNRDLGMKLMERSTGEAQGAVRLRERIGGVLIRSHRRGGLGRASTSHGALAYHDGVSNHALTAWVNEDMLVRFVMQVLRDHVFWMTSL
jgi:hypothetical protein